MRKNMKGSKTFINVSDAKTDKNDVEQRRVNRTGTILAIIALVGTLLLFLFKITINALNIWSAKSIIYRLAQIVFVSILSSVIWIILDIILYIIKDMKRNNVIDEKHKLYDTESDERYAVLIKDIEVYFIINLIMGAICVPVIEENENKIIFLFIIVIYAFVLAVSIILFNHGYKKSDITQLIYRVGKLVGLSLVIYVICLEVILAKKHNEINVNFAVDGTVTIENVAVGNYDSMQVNLYDSMGNELYSRLIQNDEVLVAREFKTKESLQNRYSSMNAILIDSEYIYNKYSYNIGDDDICDENLKYYIEIIIYSETENVVLLNSFYCRNERYYYAKDYMEKQYK